MGLERDDRPLHRRGELQRGGAGHTTHPPNPHVNSEQDEVGDRHKEQRRRVQQFRSPTLPQTDDKSGLGR